MPKLTDGVTVSVLIYFFWFIIASAIWFATFAAFWVYGCFKNN